MRKAGTGNKPAGGYGSRQVRNVPVRTGDRSLNKMSPGGVGQQGLAQGGMMKHSDSHSSRNSAMSMYEGKAREPVELGNNKALKAKGVGQDRDVHRSGSQGTHGPVNPGNPASVTPRDILDSFGPTIPGRR
jgi:hypothetical protein